MKKSDTCWCNHDLAVRSWRIYEVTKWYQVMDDTDEVPTGVFPGFPGRGWARAGCNVSVNAGVDAGAGIGRHSVAVPVSWTCAPRYF